ncbi:hypothetical protein L1887_34692 [Cichorium endivia]|nr:hypothetical protein L1887_34692 [Cichorium endivia]
MTIRKKTHLLCHRQVAQSCHAHKRTRLEDGRSCHISGDYSLFRSATLYPLPLPIAPFSLCKISLSLCLVHTIRNQVKLAFIIDSITA